MLSVTKNQLWRFLLSAVFALAISPVALSQEESENEDVFRNRPFRSNRSIVVPPETQPSTRPETVSTIVSSQPARTIDLPSGKTVAWIPVGSGASNFDKLGNQLGEMAQKMDWGGGDLSAYVEDARYVIPVLDYQADKPMIPASCQKLITFAAALKLLGADFRFETLLEGTGPIAKKTLKGNLVVRGSGDPSLSTRYLPKQTSAARPFVEWASQLRRAGIHAIEGHIIGDASAFDSATHGPGWPEGMTGDPRVPEVSALSFNDNLIDFVWQPGKKDSQKAAYTLSPPYSAVQVFNLVRIDGREGRDWRTFERKVDANVFQAAGQLPPRQQRIDSASLYKPESFFLESFKSALASNGVEVKGLTSVLSDTDAKDLATTNSKTLFTHRSAPLGQLLIPALQNDQNLHAELIFKTLGRLHGSSGSFQGGSNAVEQYKMYNRLGAPGTIALDGSGLSRLNRATPIQLVRAFKQIEELPGGAALLAALPKPGETGLLRERFAWAPEAKGALGKVQGFGGHLPGTHTLAGSVTTAQGRKLYYAFMLNNSTLSKKNARENIERLIVTMTKSRLPAEPGKPIPPTQEEILKATSAPAQ